MNRKRQFGFSGLIRVVSLATADLLCVGLVWCAAVYGYRSIHHVHYVPSQYLAFWPVPVVFVWFNAIFRLYHGNFFYPSAPLGPVEEFRRLVGSAIITHVLAMAFLGFTREVEVLSRVVLVVGGIGTAVFSQTFRNLVRHLLKWMNVGQIPVFLVGSGKLAWMLARICADDFRLGYRIVGSFDHKGDSVEGVERLGGLRDIVSMGRAMGIRQLVVCEDERLLKEQLVDFTGHFQHIDYFPTEKSFPVIGSRLIAVGGLGGIEFVNQARMRILAWEKTAVDMTLAVIAMVLLSPFFILIPLLIKLTSRGPVFYRHHRLGKCGRPIRIWKFRSMYSDADKRLKEMLASDPAVKAEWEANFKLKKDPRVTPLGRLLRKTSLDEIPQLFNVFTRDMAMVGPRPIVEDEVRYYGDRYELFSRVKPGITGLWQASGRSETDYERRVSLDCYYVLNWSPWMDFWVILRTAFVVLTMKGAC